MTVSNPQPRTMIALLGDIHGDVSVLRSAAAKAKQAGATYLIQVGDLGWSEGLVMGVVAERLALPVLAIDGNHEDYGFLATHRHPKGGATAFGHDLTHVHRGEILHLNGLVVAFLGGAESVDKAFRHTKFSRSEGESGEYLWWEEERITEEDVAPLFAYAGKVDLLVTHTPPTFIIEKHFPASGLRMFGIDPNRWEDPSSERVEAVWKHLGKPPLVCGHMHRRIEDSGVTILDINQMTFVESLATSDSRGAR